MVKPALLDCVYARGVRIAVAGLWGAGVALASATAAVAAVRVDAAAALPYIVASALLAALLVGVVRRARWALVVSLVLLAAQVLGVLGAGLELSTGVSDVKRDELERLGFDAELGVALNLAYSLLGFAVFIWAARRYADWRRDGSPGQHRRRPAPPPS